MARSKPANHLPMQQPTRRRREPEVKEEETHDEENQTEVSEHESPEEFAKRFFGDGSPREPQDGLPTLDWLKAQFKTKSAAIRYLHSDLGGGHPPKVIAKHLGIRYQHARNVCTTLLKRGPNEDWRPKNVKPPEPEFEE